MLLMTLKRFYNLLPKIRGAERRILIQIIYYYYGNTVRSKTLNTIHIVNISIGMVVFDMTKNLKNH